MAKAVWSGSLSFGLVNIPVRLYNATSPKDVRFHQFQRGTGRRIRYRRVTEGTAGRTTLVGPRMLRGGPNRPNPTAADWVSDAPKAPNASEPMVPSTPSTPRQSEVAYEDVVKGFEIDRDRYVMVSPDELRALEPERSQTIEIEGFVDLSEIDPVSFEKSYYMAPQRGVGAEKPYALLLAALRRSNRVGIARFVMRTKEYLAAIRPMDGIVGLETLFYADEIRAVEDVDNVPRPVDVPDRELAMAEQFIDLLGMPWEPTRYRDTYRARVLELLRLRAEQEGVVEEEVAEMPAAPAGVPDLMAALRASVEAAKERGSEGGPPSASGERDDRGRGSVRALRGLAPGGDRGRRRRSGESDGPGHRGRSRLSIGPHGHASWVRPAGLPVLHELRQPQGARARGQPARSRHAPLARAASPGERHRKRGAPRSRGVRGVLPEPPARPSPGGLGLPAGRTDPRPGHAGAAVPQRGRALRRRSPPARLLGRIRTPAGRVRVLAGARGSPARPDPLHGPGGVASGTTVAMSSRSRGVAALIGKVGVWSSHLQWQPASRAQELVRLIEELGFGAVWVGEATGKESIANASVLLAGSERIVVATGIASIWARDPVAMANAGRTLNEAYPGRFLMGLGVSHPFLTEPRGRAYRTPLEHMRWYLETMEGAPWAGPPAEPAPRVVAALGPKMLELARDRTEGAHPYFVPVEHTAKARAVLGEGPLLAPEQAVALDADPTMSRELARPYLRTYLRLDNYRANLRRLGWDEEDLADAGSGRLADALVARGGVEAAAERVRAHLDAGADHVAVRVLTEDPKAFPARELEALAAVVRDL